MRRFLTAAVTLSLGLALLGFASARQKDKDTPKEPPVVKPKEGKSETIKLFNGKDIDNWEGNKDLWSVQDGEIVGKNKDEVKVSTYLLTKQNFSDFRLVCKAKLFEGSKMHSGVAFWGHVAPEKGDKYTYAGHLVMFPSDYGLFDLYGRNLLLNNKTEATKVGHQNDWNDIEILAQGNRIRVAINGAPVMDWRDPEPDRIKEGPIGLQLHSLKMPQEVRFKDITIETFPKEDKLITVKEKAKDK